MAKFIEIKSGQDKASFQISEIENISQNGNDVEIASSSSKGVIKNASLMNVINEIQNPIRDLNRDSQSNFKSVDVGGTGIEVLSNFNDVDFFDNLSASGTNREEATVLNYGVNIITFSSKDNYSLILPQPINGKKVIVINKSNYPVVVFPSNIGGTINTLNPSQPITLEESNVYYEFICVQNPNVGAWIISIPSTGQIDLGEVTINSIDTSSTNVINFVSPTDLDFSSNFNINSILAFNGVNNAPINLFEQSGVNFYGRKPSFQVNQINKIKVYTNFSANNGGSSINISGRISYAGAYNQYNPTNPSTVVQSYGQTAASLPFGVGKTVDFELSNVVGGNASILAPNQTSANIGDVGTVYGEFEYDFGAFDASNPQHIQFGDFFIGQLSSGGGSAGNLDTFWTNYFQVNLAINNTQQVINNLKFRVFLEYR
jgi:hypothetical protein